jgi:putative ABC transport system substrate-binding protein
MCGVGPMGMQMPGGKHFPVEAFAQGRTEATAAWIRSHPDYIRDQRKFARLQSGHYSALAEGLTPDSSHSSSPGRHGPQRSAAGTGLLLTYGPDLQDLFRRSAVFVDKIFKGAKPANLPVEQPTKFELVINLKTGQGSRPHCAALAAGPRRRGNRMRRREFMVVLAGAGLTWPLVASAQQPDRIRRIGVLMGVAEGHPETESRIAGFRRGLEKRGWFEGRNVRIDYRYSPGGLDAQTLAKELIAFQPDVLVANSTPILAAVQRETGEIPVVSAGVADPIGSGFVASLSHPGGNITGATLFEASVTGKWLGMLKEMAPNLTRAGFLNTPSSRTYFEYYMRAAKALAPSFKIEPLTCLVESEQAAAMERSINFLASAPNSRLVVVPDTTAVVHSDLLIKLAAQHRLPTVYFLGSFVAAGGLMSYGVDFGELFRQAAGYVDRILRGDKPGDLPVQAATPLLGLKQV